MFQRQIVERKHEMGYETTGSFEHSLLLWRDLEKIWAIKEESHL